MQLVLTPLPSFYDLNEKRILVTSAGVIPKGHHFDTLIFNHPWEDRKIYFRDIKLTENIYEKYLTHLTQSLNTLHHEANSTDFYRILIGNFLFNFIHILYERFLTLSHIAKEHQIKNTLCLDTSLFNQFTPPSTEYFTEWKFDDYYNLFLYSSILQHSKLIPYTPIKASIQLPSLPKRPHQFLKKILHKLGYLIPYKKNPTVFFSPCFPRKEFIKLNLKLKQLPIPAPESSILPLTNIDLKLRKNISLPEASTDFENLLNKMLITQIPLSFIENYQKLKTVLTKLPRKPKTIFSANPDAQSDSLKYYTAHHKNTSDTKLLIGQHGGHYGSGLYCSSQTHHLKIADSYLSWGWTLPHHNHIIPLPAQRLIRTQKLINSKPSGQLLIASHSYPLYHYYAFTSPGPYQVSSFIEDHISLVKQLSPAIQSETKIRLYPQNYGWSEKDYYKKHTPYINTKSEGLSLIQELNQSRLHIAFANSTTFLETLVANFPTILILNPNFWELHPTAKPYFQLLKDARILHHCPKEAAKFINSIFDNPTSWWNSTDTQKAINKFTHIYARTSSNPLKDWIKVLSQ